MAVIALCSAAGSPGVTTTAVGLALSWPRPVLLVEADPSGPNGILAGVLRGQVDYETGLLDLASSPLALTDALSDVVQPIVGTQVSYLAGTQTHQQATGLADLWAPLGEELANLEQTGQDVIVDAGRLGLPGSPKPLLQWADLALLATRSHLPALAGARSWVDEIRARDDWRRPGLLVIGEGEPYSVKEIRRALGLPVLAAVADDPAGAAVYHRGAPAPRRFASSGYVRSLAAAGHALRSAIASYRDALVEQVNP